MYYMWPNTFNSVNRRVTFMWILFIVYVVLWMVLPIRNYTDVHFQIFYEIILSYDNYNPVKIWTSLNF